MQAERIQRKMADYRSREMSHARLQRSDVETIRRLIAEAMADLPQPSRLACEGQPTSASEYGHWSWRMPTDTPVNVGVQRATNPS